MVLAYNASAIHTVFGVSAIQWQSGRLSNSGELIKLLDPQGNTVDSVNYSVGPPWPAHPMEVIRRLSGVILSAIMVQFTLENLGGITTAWNWHFEGGSPSYSDLRQPLVYFTHIGWHAVKLVESNAVGSFTLNFPRFIYINGSLGMAENPNSHITLMPNPARASFMLQADQQFRMQLLEILSIGEITLKRYYQPVKLSSFPIYDLAPGLYRGRLFFEDGSTMVLKLLVAP